MIEHVVEQGECVASIAASYGVPGKKVWNAPENEELREKRKSPYMLYPGDVVRVNDRDKREEACATEQHHRFERKAEKTWLRVKLLDLGEARAGEPYVLKIGGEVIEGKTDGEGKVEVEIPAHATEAVLRLGDKQRGEDFLLKVGGLDPVTEVSGVQARLANLGYDCEVTGAMDERTKRAVREFQYDNVLKMGEVSEETREELVKVYGS